MRKIILFTLIILFNMVGQAQSLEQKQAQKINELENKVSVLEEKHKLFDAAIQINEKNYSVELKAKIDEIHRQYGIFEFISIVLGLISLGAIGTMLWQVFVGFRKRIEKKENELTDEFVSKFQILEKESKEALESAIKIHGVELELMSRYPIVVVSNEVSNEPDKIQLLLKTYHFKQVFIKTYEAIKEGIKNGTINQSTVLIISKLEADREKIREIQANNVDFGIMGFWKHEDKIDCSFTKECQGFTNSYGRIYENLMSLLHYKRYLNNPG
jgi:hypothetical protein